MEIVIGVVSCIFYFTLIALASLLSMPDWLRVVLIFGGLVPFFIALLFCTRIEQKAGYYECAKCNHRYIPGYLTVLFAMHINRTRYMKCPKCGKRSWQSKVISKDENE
jgi:DNA-directed RNA polymerase subunit RPC12/RpoP